MYTAPGENLGYDLYQNAGEQFGDGWWGDRWKDAKKAATKVAKQAQRSAIVRELEKKAVQKGADVLRGAAEVATDGLADTALTAVGMPELAPLVDKAIDKGAAALEKKGVDYLDQKIDKSGEWAGNGHVRYMNAGAGMRLAGGATHVGRGLRLAGSGHCGHGMRLAGDGLLDDVGDMALDVAKSQAKKHAPEIVDRAVSFIPGVGPVAAPMAGAATRLLLGSGHCGHGMHPAGSGMRLAGSGTYVPSLVEGSGCACH